MPPKLQRSNTLKRLLLAKKDSIRITETQPVRWRPLGVQRSLYDDFSHRLFEWGWGQMFLFVASAYLVVIIAFALLLFLSGCGDRDNFLSGDFPTGMKTHEICFWFSAVNVITTGFGAIVPLSRGAYLLSCIEHFVGLLMSSLLLGIIVSKASLPTSKLVFSNVAVVRKRFGVPHFIVRVGNGRGNFLYSPEIRLSYIRFMQSPEGELVHTEAQLEVTDPVALKPVFFVQHALNQQSPLFGKTAQDLVTENGFIVLTISATDDMTLQTLHSRALYAPDDIRWNHTFEDIIVEQLDHRKQLSIRAITQMSRGIDFARFHNTTEVHDLENVSEKAAALTEIPTTTNRHKSFTTSQLVLSSAHSSQPSCESVNSTIDTRVSSCQHGQNGLLTSSSDAASHNVLDKCQNGRELSEPICQADIDKALSVLARLAQQGTWPLKPPPQSPFDSETTSQTSMADMH